MNIPNSWSRSVSAPLWPSGMVAPFGHVADEWPLVTSRNFSPIDPFSRTMNVESWGSGSTFLSSDRVITAIGCPEAVRAGSMLVTSPIRAPPMWTSLPWVSSSASGI